MGVFKMRIEKSPDFIGGLNPGNTLPPFIFYSNHNAIHTNPNYHTMANRTAQMKGGQSYLDSPKGAGQKKKATQGESKVSTRKQFICFPLFFFWPFLFLHISLFVVPRVFTSV
jgi:hypothetical protein